MKAVRDFPGERAVRIGLRTIHIGAIGVIYGAVVLGVVADIGAAWGLAMASGCGLMLDDLWRYGVTYLRRMMFWGMVFKFGCLVSAAFFPGIALFSLSLALIVGSVVSHMPGRYRYRPVWGVE